MNKWIHNYLTSSSLRSLRQGRDAGQGFEIFLLLCVFLSILPAHSPRSDPLLKHRDQAPSYTVILVNQSERRPWGGNLTRSPMNKSQIIQVKRGSAPSSQILRLIFQIKHLTLPCHGCNLDQLFLAFLARNLSVGNVRLHHRK